jgi:phosphoglycerate dehydrogenase-like enzyme
MAVTVRGRRHATALPVHVHIENTPTSAPVFRVTPEMFAAAAARHPDLANRVRVSIGDDLASFDAAMATAEVLIGWRFPRENLRARAPLLRWIHLKGAGMEHLLPLDWMPADLVLTTNSGVHAQKAGEFVTMAILMLQNAMPALMTNQRQARWQQIFSTSVVGKTLAVIGVGHMGGVAAMSARRLGLRVLGVRRSRRPHRHVDAMYGPDELHQVLPQADFVLLAAPLTAATRNLIGRPQLDLMRPGAGIINMGRGGLLDHEALVSKLARGEIGGAILDVFAPEPLPADSPLWSAPNLVITPHVSSDDAARYMPLTLDLVFSNLRRYLEGRPLRNRIRPGAEY